MVNFKNIYLKKVSNKNYVIFDGEDTLHKYIITTPKLLLPFGVEYYKGKMIINTELYGKPAGEYKIFHQTLQKIEKYFMNNIDKLIGKYNSSDIYYHSFLKQRGDESSDKLRILVRTHVKKQGRMIQTKCYDDNEEIILYDVKKGSYVKMELELGNIWIHNDKFGVTLYINKIKLV
jgi:hypothetical protein